MTLARVQKRDGRLVPFDEAKIAGAIAKAMRAVGENDEAFAGEVAGVVRMTLDERHVGDSARDVPDIEEIQDLVEQALIELGRTTVAKAYILYRDQRARVRRALEVRTTPNPDDAGRSSGGRRLQVHESDGPKPWTKGRIVAALMREAELPRELSEKVASLVEERVFGTDLKRITTGLVRELVDNELLVLGLDAALRRQVSIGVPMFDLRRLVESPQREPDPARPVAGERLTQRGVEAATVSEVLRRFGLQEVLSPDQAEAHQSGDLFVHGLERPHLPLVSSIPASILAGRPSPDEAFVQLEELGRLARGTAYGIVLEDPGVLLQPLAESGRGGAGLAAWLGALRAVAAAAGRRIDLAAPGRRAPAFARRLAEELAALADGAFAPRLFVDADELEALAMALETATLDRLLESGRVVPTWSNGAGRMTGPGTVRQAGERASLHCGGAVALNLPRLALRAGPWREDRMLEALAELVEQAVEILELQNAYQRRLLPQAGRLAYAVAPVGMREALQWLGDGEIRPDQGARLLGFLAEAVERAGKARRLSVTVTPFFGERASERFAQLDAGLPQHSQRLLFDEAAAHLPEGGRSYTCGTNLEPLPSDPGPRDTWHGEATLTSTLAVGCLHPLPGARSDLARIWRRFAELRGEPDFEPTLAPATQAAQEHEPRLFGDLPETSSASQPTGTAGL